MPDLEERELATDPNETHGASDGHLLQCTYFSQYRVKSFELMDNSVYRHIVPQRRITIDAMLAAVAAKKDGYNSSVKESSTRLANLQDKATATKTVSEHLGILQTSDLHSLLIMLRFRRPRSAGRQMTARMPLARSSRRRANHSIPLNCTWI
jgi:hypothetical protein